MGLTAPTLVLSLQVNLPSTKGTNNFLNAKAAEVSRLRLERGICRPRQSSCSLERGICRPRQSSRIRIVLAQVAKKARQEAEAKAEQEPFGARVRKCCFKALAGIAVKVSVPPSRPSNTLCP